MLFKILVLDSHGSELRKYADHSLWKEYGFEISRYTSDISAAVSAACEKECGLVICVDRPAAALSVDFLNRTARRKTEIPTIVISYLDSPKNIRECFLLGAIDCLTEPISEDDLREALVRASGVVSQRVMNSEYSKAMETALAAIELTDDNSSMLEKLGEFLVKVKGCAVTVEEAADYFGFNPDYFRRYFKRRAGISFSDFYKRLTMDYAKLLLSSGHYKVNEVSDLLGYSSSDYFTRVFKKVTGRVPSDFRK